MEKMRNATENVDYAEQERMFFRSQVFVRFSVLLPFIASSFSTFVAQLFYVNL